MFGGIAAGHQDTQLTLKDGSITGLPASYLPASFDVKLFTLIIAGKKIVIPESLRRILMRDMRADPFDDSPPQMEIIPSTFVFSSSWRREALQGDQSPYMVIMISPEGTDHLFYLNIDMENLRLESATLLINNLGSVPIDLVDRAGTQKEKNGEQPADGKTPETHQSPH